MLRQILMGGSISVCNIVIHALVMTAVVRSSQATAVKAASRPNLLLIAVMVATVSILMAAHVCEVIVWSLAYGLVDAAPADTDFLYFAFVNYTTLGYGDVVPVERWRLLGPDDGNERSAAVRLVDCGHFRGAVESDGYQGFSCRQSSEESRSSSERPHLDPEVAVIDNAELDKIIDGPERVRGGEERGGVRAAARYLFRSASVFMGSPSTAAGALQ